MATIKGVWLLKEAPYTDLVDYSINVSFTSNGVKFSALRYGVDYDDNTFLYYGSTLVCSGMFGNLTNWTNDAYRFVDFGTTEQTVPDYFRTFMDTYAIPEAEPTPTVTVEYNGETIAELQAGQQATLKCKGDNVKMHTDIVVTAPEGMGGADVPEWDGSYTVSGGVELISFTIDGDHYEAVDGMYWSEWIESEYNTLGLELGYRGSVSTHTGYLTHLGDPVNGGHLILADEPYVIESASSN